MISLSKMPQHIVTLVAHPGLEPGTPRLKVLCSTNWASGPNILNILIFFDFVKINLKFLDFFLSFDKFWQGWQDLNLRMQESKSCALPLGDTPTMSIYVAGVVGFEPTDVGVRVQCLTAWRHPTAKAEILWGDRRESNPWPPEPQSGVLPIELRPPYGAPRRIRTFDLCLRRALLYPAELWKQSGAGEGNRTLATSLEG